MSVDSKILLILNQIAAKEKSTSPTYIDRKQCAELARSALELLGHPFLEATEAAADPVQGSRDAPAAPTEVANYLINTDGACKGNPGPAALGLAIERDGVLIYTKGEYLGTATNQIAELSAAIEALSLIPAGSSFTLVSDSQYVLKGLTEWRAGWERRGMCNSAGEPVANLDKWRKLYALADARKLIKTKWVKGHSGDPMNELCDQLANRAITAKGTVH